MKNKRILAALLTVCIQIQTCMCPVYGAEQNDMQEKVTTATILLEKILNEKYEKQIEELKKEITVKGYDYDLTMNTVYEKGNPYETMDFEKILAAYMTCQNYSQKKNGSRNGGIGNIPFLTYRLSENSIVEKKAYKIELYEEAEDGLFDKTGYTYVNEDKTVGIYKETEDGRYKKVGEEEKEAPEYKTTYAEVTFYPLTAEKMFEHYGIKNDDSNDEYQRYISILNEITSSDMMRQNIFLELPSYETIEQGEIDQDVTPIRKRLLQTAASLKGQVPYQWGGKPAQAGYDHTWWTFEKGSQKGLDCSGYVQWVYRTAGLSEYIWEQMTSTSAIVHSNFKEIAEEELQPGDIGILNRSGNNHTGIYAGNGLWYHCSSQANTVVLSNYDFKIFYNPILSVPHENNTWHNSENDTLENIDNGQIMVYYTNNGDYTENDVYLLAQLISHEAGGEGLNGWIAVGEVVMNRVRSELFPNTIEEVVFAPGQFSNNDRIRKITPRQEIIQTAREILNGRLSVLNNENALYFRNPLTTEGIKATESVDWGEHKYLTCVGHHAFYVQ